MQLAGWLRSRQDPSQCSTWSSVIIHTENFFPVALEIQMVSFSGNKRHRFQRQRGRDHGRACLQRMLCLNMRSLFKKILSRKVCVIRFAYFPTFHLSFVVWAFESLFVIIENLVNSGFRLTILLLDSVVWRPPWDLGRWCGKSWIVSFDIKSLFALQELFNLEDLTELNSVAYA